MSTPPPQAPNTSEDVANPAVETDTPPQPDGSRSEEPFSQRLERSRRGRVILSLFIIVLVGSLLVINAPATSTKRGLMTVVGPVLSALGMEQGWGVFAPNPRRFSLTVEAHIQQLDGSDRVVPIESGRGVTEYWTYRWQRWADRLAAGPDNVAMWDPYCRYLADQDRASGGRPVRVALLVRRLDSRGPGPGPSTGESTTREIFAVGVAP